MVWDQLFCFDNRFQLFWKSIPTNQNENITYENAVFQISSNSYIVFYQPDDYNSYE